MAIEVAVAFNAELGIAITGYAQPIPKISINSCFAHIALAEDSKIVFSQKITGDSSKTLIENQFIFMEKVVNELLKVRS